MKMSDVFVSMVDAGDISVFTGRVRDCCDDSVIPHEAVAHAINNHDALVEALQKARTGYLNLIELELLPHQGYYDECQEHINEMDKVLANARGES